MKIYFYKGSTLHHQAPKLQNEDIYYSTADYQRFATLENLRNHHKLIYSFEGYSRQGTGVKEGATTYDCFVAPLEILQGTTIIQVQLLFNEVPSLSTDTTGLQHSTITYLVYCLADGNREEVDWLDVYDTDSRCPFYGARSDIQEQLLLFRSLRSNAENIVKRTVDLTTDSEDEPSLEDFGINYLVNYQAEVPPLILETDDLVSYQVFESTSTVPVPSVHQD